MTGTITYAPGRRPMVREDCSDCQGTGMGYVGTDAKCPFCKGRGYSDHTVDLDCECVGCRTYRGELCDECGAERELDEDRYMPCEVCS